MIKTDLKSKQRLCTEAAVAILCYVGRKVRNILLRLFLPVVGFVLALNACSLLGTDISDRINAFIATLNSSDRSSIASDFDPGLASTLSAVSWNTVFPVPQTTDLPYSVTLNDYSNPSNVTASMIGPASFTTSGLALSAVFSMVKIGADWYIEGLTVGTVVIP